jgi:hypothetical protein
MAVALVAGETLTALDGLAAAVVVRERDGVMSAPLASDVTTLVTCKNIHCGRIECDGRTLLAYRFARPALSAVARTLSGGGVTSRAVPAVTALDAVVAPLVRLALCKRPPVADTYAQRHVRSSQVSPLIPGLQRTMSSKPSSNIHSPGIPVLPYSSRYMMLPVPEVGSA